MDAQRAGTLDKNFGDTGVVITNFPGYYNVFNRSWVLEDDKIIVSSTFGTSFDMQGIALTRYLPDGNIDVSFGNQGTTKILNNISPTSLAVQNDGKIIISGIYESGVLVVARFLSSGAPDSSFANNGFFIDAESLRFLTAADIGLQPDGKIIVCGMSYYGDNGSRDPFLERFTTEGIPDQTFGESGFTMNTNSSHFSTTMIIQKDRKIVTGGEDDDAGTFSLLRYTAEGSIDSSFGINGKVLTTFASEYENVISDLALQSDNKIVAVGQVGQRPFRKAYIGVTRYNTDGCIDNTFGTEGKTQVKFDSISKANAVVIQKNEKIVVTGWVGTKDQNFLVMRLSPNGSLDTSFVSGGKAVTNINSTQDQALSVGLQSDGNIIVGGQEITSATASDVVLVKYYGDPIKQLGPIAKKIKRWIRNHTLNWQYNADVDYFVIEQSSNGINGFKEIARVKANERRTMNNEQWVYTYNLNDFANGQQLKANSKTYYHITAISNNNKVVSDVISDEDVISITISPNPVKDVMKISGLLSAQKSTINIINRNGNVLQTTISNSSTYNMNISQLKSGLYNVQITTGNKNKPYNS